MRFCRPRVREVCRVRLEASDVVVLKLSANITQATVERMLAEAKSAFPDNRIAVVEDGVTLAVWGKAKVDE